MLWAQSEVLTRALWSACKRLANAHELCEDFLGPTDAKTMEARSELGQVLVPLIKDLYAIAYNVDKQNVNPIGMAQTQGVYIGTPLHEGNIPLALDFVERLFFELLPQVNQLHAPWDPVVAVMVQFRPQLLELYADRQRRLDFHGKGACRNFELHLPTHSCYFDANTLSGRGNLFTRRCESVISPRSYTGCLANIAHCSTDFPPPLGDR